MHAVNRVDHWPSPPALSLSCTQLTGWQARPSEIIEASLAVKESKFGEKVYKVALPHFISVDAKCVCRMLS